MSDDPSAPGSATDKHRWFGFAGAAAAWVALGIGDLLITWRACLHQAEYGGPIAHPVARVLYFVITFVFLGLAFISAAVSYRKLSGWTALLCAEGTERPEFMTLAGLFISLTLGAGIVWLCLPLFILQMCLRAR